MKLLNLILIFLISLNAVAARKIVGDVIVNSSSGTSIIKIPSSALSSGVISIDGSGNLSAAASSVPWGAITGTLSSQTDLQTALNAKSDKDPSALSSLGFASWATNDVFNIYDTSASTLKKTTVLDFDGRYVLQSSVGTIAQGGTNSSSALSGSSIMISNGSAIVQGAAGTTTTLLHGNAAGAPTYSAASLTTDVSGVLPRANGGTGLAVAGTSGNLLTSDGTDWISSAIAALTSLNGLTANVQTFAMGSSGTTPAFVSATSTHTLNIPLASGAGVTSGTISKTDYDAFTAKQPAGNYITALTGDVTASGPGSVAATIANLAVTNAKIANATINLTTKVTGALPVANGGTNSSTALSGSSIMVSDGTSVVQGAAGTTTTLLHGNAAGAPTYGAVSLTADVLGILPVAKGGTNSSTALSGTSLMISDGTSVVQGAAGTTTTLLHGNAAGAPTYSAASLTTDVTGVLPVANGGTNSSTALNSNRMVITSAGKIVETTAMTTGSALFADTNGLPAQDNSNYFWDDTNNRLGIGTASPAQSLDVRGNIFAGVVGGAGKLFFPTTTSSNIPTIESIFATNNLKLSTSTVSLLQLNGNGTITSTGHWFITGGDGSTPLIVSQGNAAYTSTLFEVRDNNVTKFAIADGGAVGIGGFVTAASAALEVISTTQGFLPPKMTTTQKNAISSPATGLTLFDTTLGLLGYYNGSSWVSLASSTSVTMSATTAAGQTINNATSTTVVFGTVVKDSGSYYNSATGVYTPLIAGDYEICSTTTFVPNSVLGVRIMYVYKNNSLYRTVNGVQAGSNMQAVQGCTLITDMNGSTDNLRINVYQNKGTSEVLSSVAEENFISIARVP